MLVDKRSKFCAATALNTGAAGTYNLGDVYDLEVARDIGVTGRPLFLVLTAATAIAVASSTGTVAFQLVSDSTSAPSTDGSQTTHLRTAAFATSTSPIPAGSVLGVIALPQEGNVYERYLGIQQVTGTTAISAGAINAFLTTDPQGYKIYAAQT